MLAGKRFQSVQPPESIERLCIEFNCCMCGVDASATAGNFLGMPRMRCAVSAQKKLRIATRCRAKQRLSVHFAFQHRQAVVMWTNATREQTVAIEQQMMCRNRRRDARCATLDKLDGVLRGDVLEHDAQVWKCAHRRLKLFGQEDVFSVENVHVGVGDLAMHQQRQVVCLHCGKRVIAAREIAHACI